MEFGDWEILLPRSLDSSLCLRRSRTVISWPDRDNAKAEERPTMPKPIIMIERQVFALGAIVVAMITCNVEISNDDKRDEALRREKAKRTNLFKRATGLGTLDR
jgi:hypothetical protein